MTSRRADHYPAFLATLFSAGFRPFFFFGGAARRHHDRTLGSLVLGVHRNSD